MDYMHNSLGLLICMSLMRTKYVTKKLSVHRMKQLKALFLEVVFLVGLIHYYSSHVEQ